jgi:phosphatidylglycerol:prolipoprotein diacylglycerol transferase
MLVHPQFDPIALAIGPVALHWYGLMYAVAFLSFVAVGKRQVARMAAWPPPLGERWQRHDPDDMLVWGMLGVVLGGRLGYVLFYQPAFYAEHPAQIVAVWQGGMSFHGGLIGVLLALAWYARRRGLAFFQVMDFVAPCVPLGLAAGRLGNFINGELWGRVADPSLPWAMVFPQVDSQPRHPSQLYQMALEGVLLFVVLWWFARRPRPVGQVSAVFLMGYGVLRFVAEYFRQPDSYLGLLSLGLSMGQWLSLPMVVAGALLWRHAARRAATP